jgi:hypothetical protein
MNDSTPWETNAVVRALAVMVCDRNHRAWLKAHDPKALEQAQKALREIGYHIPTTVYDPTVLEDDQIAALRACSLHPDEVTDIPSRIGQQLQDRGLVEEVSETRPYRVTSRGRLIEAALAAKVVG